LVTRRGKKRAITAYELKGGAFLSVGKEIVIRRQGRKGSTDTIVKNQRGKGKEDGVFEPRIRTKKRGDRRKDIEKKNESRKDRKQQLQRRSAEASQRGGSIGREKKKRISLSDQEGLSASEFRDFLQKRQRVNAREG